MDKFDKGEEWQPPVYVLLDLTTKKAIGYYGLTEADRLELESELYLSNNPHLSRENIAVSIDKWGFSVPSVNRIDEFM